MLQCRAELGELQAAIQADSEELLNLDSLAQSKLKAIAKNEESLRRDAIWLSDLKSELGSKELGKLSKAEVKEKQDLTKAIAQLQVQA